MAPEFQFPDPNFSHEIVVLLFESKIKFSNRNFSSEITVSLFESEFKFSNPNFIAETAISTSELHFQYHNIALNITDQDFNFIIHFSQFSILV